MIREELRKLIWKAVNEEVSFERPENPEHGDYSTNIALVLAKKQGKDPRQVAETLVSSLDRRGLDFLGKVEVAGPGFINFFLSRKYFLKVLSSIAKEKEKYGSGKERKRIIVEYSSPNIAKPFGVGHLRSTLIGQALYNLYKFLGYECIGINYPGDWGTPHGKILYQLSEKLLKGKSEKERKEILKSLTPQDLEKLYVGFHEEAQQDPTMEEEARIWFKKLEMKDKEARMIWEHIRRVSMEEFERIYSFLDVHIDYLIGESFFEGKMKEVVEDFKKKGLAHESHGAFIVPFPGEALPPAMLLKTDGATTYFTRDLANMKYRIQRWKPDIIAIETGNEQILHFKQVFSASKLIGYATKEKLVHVFHGLYRTQEGKFSTRKGQTVHLEEVLREAIEKASAIIGQSETARGLSPEEKEKVARAIGIGGMKYNDLIQHPSGDIIFDWAKILNLKGNSAAYIQYTFARCRSILKKAEAMPRNAGDAYEFSKEETEIIRTLNAFPEVARDAAERFSPNLVANFVFDLAQKYNLFYGTHSVLQAETKEAKEFRLFLTQAVAQVIKNSLSLLGIQTPERM
ncbi:MAG: arginine--tRNA ligase [Candidatus Wildermuthbacteria bacterium]|nr:arginine--tRNA ligase [Candidatus Wildermuthbacteria bacterium]